DQGDDLVGGGAVARRPGGEQHLGAEPGGDRVRVDGADVDALDGGGGRAGRLVGGGEVARQVDADDGVGALVGQLPEALVERPGRGGRRLGQVRRLGHAPVELVDVELDPVDE